MPEDDERPDESEYEFDDALDDAVHPRCQVTPHPAYNTLAMYSVKQDGYQGVFFLCEIHGLKALEAPEAKHLIIERL